MSVVILLFTFTLSACETEQVRDEIETPGTAAGQVEGAQELQSDIEARLNEFDDEISELEMASTSVSEEARANIESQLREVRDEREDIVELQQELALAGSQREVAEIRQDLWEESRDLDELLTEARLEAASEREEFSNVIESKIADLEQDIQELEAEAANVSGEIQREYNEEIAELRQQREAFQQEWDGFQQTTEENWQDAKTRAIQGWRNIREKF